MSLIGYRMTGDCWKGESLIPMTLLLSVQTAEDSPSHLHTVPTLSARRLHIMLLALYPGRPP